MKISLSGSQANTKIRNMKGILGLDEVSEVPTYLGWLFIVNVRSNRSSVNLSIELQRRHEDQKHY